MSAGGKVARMVLKLSAAGIGYMREPLASPVQLTAILILASGACYILELLWCARPDCGDAGFHDVSFGVAVNLS